MKKQNLTKLLTLLISFIFIITSTTTLAQTVKINSGKHEITQTDLRVANQIFVEHKAYKKVSEEQEVQLKKSEEKINLLVEKNDLTNQTVNNKVLIIQNLTDTYTIKEAVYKEEIKVQKKNKNFYKIATIVLSLALGAAIITNQ